MRDQLLAAIKAQLERIEATGDLALALEPGALNDAYRLVEVLGDGDIEVPYVLGWFHWYRYLALPEGQDHGALEEATRVLTLCFITGVKGLPEPLGHLPGSPTTRSTLLSTYVSRRQVPAI